MAERPDYEIARQVLEQLKAGRVISVLSAPTMRLADTRALILLSQLVYWTVKDRTAAKADGWFSKPYRDLMAETVLSRAYLQSSVNTLEQLGVLKVWQRQAKSAPWFKVDLDALVTLCMGVPSTRPMLLTDFVSNQSLRESVIGRPMPYYTAIADAVSDALLGFFLSRCVFWQETLLAKKKINLKSPAWGWSSKDWFADTGMTRAQIRRATNQAEKIGLLSVFDAVDAASGAQTVWVDFAAIDKAISVPDEKEEPAGFVRDSGVHSVDSTKAADNHTAKSDICPSDTVREVDSIKSPYNHTVKSSIGPFVTVHFADSDKAPYNHTILSDIGPLAGQTYVAPEKSLLLPQSQISRGFAADFEQPNLVNAHPEAVNPHPEAVYEQSTRARKQGLRVDYKTTTTGEASQLVPPSGQQPDVVVVFPEWVSVEEAQASRDVLKAAPVDRRQMLVDEVAGRRMAGGHIRSFVSLLSYLVRLDADMRGMGQSGIVFECQHLAEKARANADARAKQRAASVFPQNNSQAVPEKTKGEIRQRFAELRSMLDRPVPDNTKDLP